MSNIKKLFGFISIVLLCLFLSSCGEPWILPLSSPETTHENSSLVRVSTPVGPQTGKVDQTLTYTMGINTNLGEGCKYGFN